MVVDQLQRWSNLREPRATSDRVGIPVPLDEPRFLEEREMMVIQCDPEFGRLLRLRRDFRDRQFGRGIVAEQ